MTTSHFIICTKSGSHLDITAAGAYQAKLKTQSAGGMLIYILAGLLVCLAAASPTVMAEPNSATKPATASAPVTTTSGATSKPMTQIVPLWAGGYLHISDISSLLEHLPVQLFNSTTRPGTTTQAHKPGKAPTTRSVAQLTAQIFGSGGSAFIQNLLGKEFALAWGGWDMPDNFPFTMAYTALFEKGAVEFNS